MKRLYKATGDEFLEFHKREIGISRPRNFSRQISASEVTVKHLDLYGKLNGHEGCVNTTDFNAAGNVLVSGSDDRRVIPWDWENQNCLTHQATWTTYIGSRQTFTSLSSFNFLVNYNKSF